MIQTTVGVHGQDVRHRAVRRGVHADVRAPDRDHFAHQNQQERP